MSSRSWLTDSRREMAVELHKELLESGASEVRRRLKASAPVAAPSLVDAGAAWDEETPVDSQIDETTEPEALWAALAELEAEVVEELRKPSWQWPATDWGMSVWEPAQPEPTIPARPSPRLAQGTSDPTAEPDKLVTRTAKRSARGTADLTAEPQRAFDVLMTARRSHVVIARRELPAKATSRPTILSAWDMATHSTRRHAIKLVAIWTLGIALVCAGLIAAGMAMP